jgi:hypothetical protein
MLHISASHTVPKTETATSLVFVILGLYGPMGPNLCIRPLPLLQLDRVFAASEAGQA